MNLPAYCGNLKMSINTNIDAKAWGEEFENDEGEKNGFEYLHGRNE